MSTIKVTWITSAEERIEADVPLGEPLMNAAQNNNVPGIIGECGGALSCATCHVYVENMDQLLKEREPGEDDMLEFSVTPPLPSSRLSCQIVASQDIDGIVLRVPAE
ncbi:2Fe-2S iron-sulfur cluster-binding protein [Oceanicola sp. 502str15]|uniref:2Fe-2S iron-sulfur cluster-binding protein n=1 Tax=Oceanicola sp. 502str15 TaxID=2696061 RepID=UPI002095CC3A|nr:2Fe-2S iron-sulfur cluster-binding protein [Oceanicola sp. 502str15]MCO6385318.1 2Fe-2S iron-sulfur cluster binding domain-containing protein [Oceanicola sp. 502str15]